MTMTERQARAGLTRLVEPGDRQANALLHLGAQEAFERLQAAAGRTIEPDRDLEEAERGNISFIIPGDPEWPHWLSDLEGAPRRSGIGGAPYGLWVKGSMNLRAVTDNSVSIVGSRSATMYGTDVAVDLACKLAEEGLTIVSGGAYGIDVGAHRGAMAARGLTVAVLACGADRVYPSGNASVLDHIGRTGLIVSELPPGCAPTKSRFLARNRIIAALGRGTIVVEAAVRSGALHTAAWAESIGRPVMGVPGPVTSAPSAGVHDLLQSGRAHLITNSKDVFNHIA